MPSSSSSAYHGQDNVRRFDKRRRRKGDRTGHTRAGHIRAAPITPQVNLIDELRFGAEQWAEPADGDCTTVVFRKLPAYVRYSVLRVQTCRPVVEHFNKRCGVQRVVSCCVTHGLGAMCQYGPVVRMGRLQERVATLQGMPSARIHTIYDAMSGMRFDLPNSSGLPPGRSFRVGLPKSTTGIQLTELASDLGLSIAKLASLCLVSSLSTIGSVMVDGREHAVILEDVRCEMECAVETFGTMLEERVRLGERALDKR